MPRGVILAMFFLLVLVKYVLCGTTGFFLPGSRHSGGLWFGLGCWQGFVVVFVGVVVWLLVVFVVFVVFCFVWFVVCFVLLLFVGSIVIVNVLLVVRCVPSVA